MSDLILIVEDEADLLQTLVYNLEREGYQTRTATNGTDALNEARAKPIPDLILLDLMLPDFPGTKVCRQLRSQDATREIPVVMCTAKGEEIDRVVGFEVGADDYVVKPYSVRELLLRVRAVLRRSHAHKEPDANTRYTFGRLEVDVVGHRIWVDSNEIRLTALEFRLLNTFYERRGRVQTRDVLLRDVWGYHADLTTRTVDTHIKRLREKLGEIGEYVETVRGVGYRFRAQPNESL